MTDSKEKESRLKERVRSMLNTIKKTLSNSYCCIKGISAITLGRYKILAMHLKVAIVAGIGVILLIVLVTIFSGHHHGSASSVIASKPTIKPVSSIKKINLSESMTGGVNDDLTDLQAKLANIEKMLSNRRSVVNIDKVRTDIHGLNQEITQIEQENKAQYSALRSQITSLSSQLGAYQKTTTSKLNEIEAVKNKVSCLSSSHLPFTVQSIDRVNGRNVVSILYANRISPLENDFTLVGWKLTSSNYAHQSARFVNRKGVCVSVNIKDNF